jgi:hypothetical protein
MTAEIAIINRSAVTLATDSAVTLTVRSAEKIYNAADKLFELSDVDPIGIMIYNNLDFMGVDLEVAIKEFRRKVATVSYASVFEAAEAFFHYLTSDASTAPDDEMQREHIRLLLHPLLREINTVVVQAMRREFHGKYELVDFSTLWTDTLQSLLSDLEAIEPSGCFEGVSDTDLLNTYSDVIDEEIKRNFGHASLEDLHRDLLRRACGLALHRDEYSDSSTGIVFAGFGAGELSPSLVAYQVDGVISNRLKRKQIERVVTNRKEVTGEIIPFAQRDMVDRFLYGIDPMFERGIEQYLKMQMETVGIALVDSLPRTSRETKEALKQNVGAAVALALRIWRQRMMPAVKAEFVREVQDMIFLMPKQELAELAKELVNLTSVKRKFSSGKESVGGPIDVAVISRTDGFVWVQRKHYFAPNLNPGYFHRKYGSAHA